MYDLIFFLLIKVPATSQLQSTFFFFLVRIIQVSPVGLLGPEIYSSPYPPHLPSQRLWYFFFDGYPHNHHDI